MDRDYKFWCRDVSTSPYTDSGRLSVSSLKPSTCSLDSLYPPNFLL